MRPISVGKNQSKLQPRFCNRKTIIICISIYWFPFFEAITLALLFMAAAEIKKLCCLVHNTADDEPRFEKKKHNPQCCKVTRPCRVIQDNVGRRTTGSHTKRRRLYCPDKTTNNRQQWQTMGKKKTLGKA